MGRRKGPQIPTLSLAQLCQEALTLLAVFRARPQRADRFLGLIHEFGGPQAPHPCRYGKQQFCTTMAIHPSWRYKNVQWAVDHFLGPMTAELARKIPPGTILGGNFMELPRGLDAVANKRYQGVALRGILTEFLMKTPEVVPWQETKKIYDMYSDEMILGPVALVLRFDVYEAYESKDPLGLPDWRGAALQSAIRKS